VPELPEVETVRRQMETLILGAMVTSTVSRHARYQVPDLVGCVIVGVRRRGKYLLLDIQNRGMLVMHLGMTGQLLWNAEIGKHVHFELSTATGTLYFRDPRRFGSVRFIEPGDSLPATLQRLGQEPGAGLSIKDAAAKLSQGGSPIKAKLLDQRAVAGVGNYLADEALHAAKIHPACRALTTRQAFRLIRALNGKVMSSIEHGGVSERDYVHLDGGKGGYQKLLRCYGRNGKPCFNCGTVLIKILVAGRGSTFCPKCQRV
jgi:formamidopyrimidine-DNA glycosylase